MLYEAELLKTHFRGLLFQGQSVARLTIKWGWGGEILGIGATHLYQLPFPLFLAHTPIPPSFLPPPFPPSSPVIWRGVGAGRQDLIGPEMVYYNYADSNHF